MTIKQQRVRTRGKAAATAARVPAKSPTAKSTAGTVPASTAISGPVTTTRFRKYDPRFYENMAGKWEDFHYSQLRRDGRDRPVTATGYLREKLRWPSGSLDSAPLARDVVANSLALPASAPDAFSRSAQVWALVDDDRDAWKDDRHLLVSVTLWYPGCRTAHLAHRTSVTFAQGLADDFGVAAQIVLHDPSRISHPGDIHAHVVITANEVRSGGRGMFVRPLLKDTAQRLLWERWQSLVATLPSAQRP